MHMPNFKHVTCHDNVAGDRRSPLEPWENGMWTTFEIVPSGKLDADVRLAKQIEALVDEYITRKDGPARVEIVKRLLKLRSSRRLVWPSLVFFGMTEIKGEALFHLTNTVMKVDPKAKAMRVFFETLEDAPHRNWNDRKRADAAAAIFKCVACVIYSTTEQIEVEDGFTELHFERIVQCVDRRDPMWDDEYKREEFRRATKKTAAFFAALHQNNRFGVAAMRTLGARGDKPENAFDEDWGIARWLQIYAKAWIGGQPLLSDKTHRRVMVHLLRFVQMKISIRENGDPRTAFARKHMVAMVEDSATWTPSLVWRVESLNQILNFLHWLRKHLVDLKRPTFEVLLSKDDYAELLVEGPPRRNSEDMVSARPMRIDFHDRLAKIITADDFAWPRSLRDANGDLTHFVYSLDPALKGSKPIFCPVIPRLLLLLLELPIRTVQARRLDSGEGDPRRWNSSSKAWQPNSGRNAGHWRQIGAKRSARGVICEGQSGDGKSVTGLWINSNKTQDKRKGFDENSGYFIPWHHESVIENVIALRQWQEQHNPVAEPLPHYMLSKGSFGDSPSKLVAGVLPDRFYLFRMNQGVGRSGRESPVTYDQLKTFFLAALGKLEEQLRETDPEVTIVDRNKHGVPINAIYSMHGMRSALLTQLSDAGVPLEIVSRLIAGHASILMTLKYLKHDFKHVSEVLSGARLLRMDQDRAAFPQQIMEAGVDRAKAFTARVSDDAFEQTRGMNADATAWSQLEIGLCPNQGTRCAEGGKRTTSRHQTRVRSRSAPLPGGRTCVRCRFLITGLPFLLPLWAQAMAAGANFDALKNEVERQEKVVDEMRVEKYGLDVRKEAVDRQFVSRLKRAEEVLATLQAKRNVAIGDLQATMDLVEKVRAIANDPAAMEAGGMALLVEEQEIPEIVGRDATRFEVVDAVVQASVVFPSVRSPDLEREHLATMDRILYRSGMEPLMASSLSESEIRLAANAIGKYLLTRREAAEMEALLGGEKTLQDLGLREEVSEVCRAAMGRPLSPISVQEKVAPLMMHAAE